MKTVVFTCDGGTDIETLVEGIRPGLPAYNLAIAATSDSSFKQWEQADLIVLLSDGFNSELPSKCKTFRETGGSTPIMILSGTGGFTSNLQWLDAGVDTCVPGNLDLPLVISRINSVLKNPYRRQGHDFMTRDLRVDARKRTVWKNNRVVDLRPKEFMLLEHFLRHPRKVYSATDLLGLLWRSATLASEETVRTHIKTLRNKIDDEGAPSIIKTVNGSGYILAG